MHVADSIEVFLLVVLAERRDKVVEFAGGAVENLAFAVYYIFLQVEGYGFCRAEIFHCIGNAHTHLVAQTEKVVDCRAGCENNGGEIVDVDFLLTKFTGAETFHFDKGAEHDLNSIAFRDVEIWGFLRCRFGL